MKLFSALKQRKRYNPNGSGEPTAPGCKCGSKPKLGLDLFLSEEGGYTSLSVALALLLSLTLTFSLVAGTWVQNRSADTQSVADAAALAGSDVVGSYMTLATTLDACVLTMGIAGVLTLGAGLVVSAIPGLGAAGAETMQAANNILSARQSFATSASQGLQKLEATLPLIIAARSGAVVDANSTDSVQYVGCAIGYPLESKSDFSTLDSALDTTEADKIAKELQEKSDRAKELEDEMDAALYEGWLADCGDKPMNAYERTQKLAGLGTTGAYPYCASAKDWNFGYALARAKAYYTRRFSQENPGNYGSQKEKSDSVVRRYFYQYALSVLEKGSYVEHLDGSVDLNLPKLPANSQELKQTPLYTSYLFPYSAVGSKLQIHGTDECAAKHGGVSGYITLAAWDSSAKTICSQCEFYTLSMANVSSASTNINNGYEHYWRRICEAALTYEKAADELAQVKQELKDLSESAASLYNQLLETLAVARPKLCPPGAYGVVAAVWRGGDLEAPNKLSSSFTGELEVGAGAAVSGAALAPDENTASNNVISRMFEAISYEIAGSEAGVLGSIGNLWGSILEGYTNVYGGVTSAAENVLAKIDGIPGSSAAEWLCGKVGELVQAAGFEPTDLRLLKPVLTNSQNVLDKAGLTGVDSARSFVELLGQSGDAQTFAHTLGLELQNQLEGSEFTLAEIPIPGTDTSFPITVDIGELMGQVVS